MMSHAASSGSGHVLAWLSSPCWMQRKACRIMFNLCSWFGWYPDTHATVVFVMMLTAVFKPYTLGQRATMALKMVWSSWSSGTGRGPVSPSSRLLSMARSVPAGTKTRSPAASCSPGSGNSKGTGRRRGRRPTSVDASPFHLDLVVRLVSEISSRFLGPKPWRDEI